MISGSNDALNPLQNFTAAVSLLTHFVGKNLQRWENRMLLLHSTKLNARKKLIFCHMPLKRDANEAFQNWSADVRSTMTVGVEVSSINPRELINEMFASSEDVFHTIFWCLQFVYLNHVYKLNV